MVNYNISPPHAIIVGPTEEDKSLLPPSIPLVDKRYSMEADMLFGWKPKYAPELSIPITFKTGFLDSIISYLEELEEEEKSINMKLMGLGEGLFLRPQVVYRGFRPDDTYEMHNRFSSNPEYDNGILEKLERVKAMNNQKRDDPNKDSKIGIGMSKDVSKDCLIFDSMFEGGNLDCVIRVGANEYDLFMRSDTNTRGHTNWLEILLELR